MGNRVSSKIRNFDFLGQEFQPQFAGNSQFSTIIGGILSLVVSVLTFLTISIYLYDFLDYTSPEVLVTSTKQSIFPKYDLFEKRFLIMLHFRQGGAPVPNSSIPTLLTLNSFTFKILRNDEEFDFTRK